MRMTLRTTLLAAGCLLGACQPPTPGAGLPRAVCNARGTIGTFECPDGGRMECPDAAHSTDWMCEGTLGTNLHARCAAGALWVVCVPDQQPDTGVVGDAN